MDGAAGRGRVPPGDHEAEAELSLLALYLCSCAPPSTMTPTTDEDSVNDDAEELGDELIARICAKPLRSEHRAEKRRRANARLINGLNADQFEARPPDDYFAGLFCLP